MVSLLFGEHVELFYTGRCTANSIADIAKDLNVNIRMRNQEHLHRRGS